VSFLHKKKVARALYYASRWRLKKLLRLPETPNLHVVEGDAQHAINRHKRVCQTLAPYFSTLSQLSDGIAAEIGSGDCLAAADMVLAMGARHVHLIDQQPIIVSPQQRVIIDTLACDELLPNSGCILMPDDPVRLNTQKASTQTGLLEDIGLPEAPDLVYSFDVLEHVEDLRGFFYRCRQMSKPGTLHVHKFDLSGHEFFEDPLPPLDFQTYPSWLFNLIFPRYRRAVGHFADDIIDAMRQSGLHIEQIVSLRTADPAYLEEIWPKLRKEARLHPKSIVSMLDVLVVAKTF
jgi:hypothetical protein